MHLARHLLRVLIAPIAVAALSCALSRTADADRVPLVGTGAPAPIGNSNIVNHASSVIVSVDPSTVPCSAISTFDDVQGGAAPGVSYDGFLSSGGVRFAERFVGQTLSYNGNFDVVSGIPTNPLTLQAGLPGQNLDVFDYATNVLTGLGPLGYPDIDAIGEGSMAMLFPVPQFALTFQVVGGNGGTATLTFYRADGSLMDTIDISGLADLAYGFATDDGSSTISGVLIQNTDPSGIGLDNVCHEGGVTAARGATWGALKVLYR
jgi:hypothetical protein